MSLHSTSLREYVQPVPFCSETVPLARVLELFGQKRCDRVIVVNAQQHPTYVVQLSRCLPYLLPDEPGTALLSMGGPQGLLESVLDEIGEPIWTVPGNWTVAKLLQQVEFAQLVNCAVLDLDGSYMGLLDPAQLLLAVRSHLPISAPIAALPGAAGFDRLPQWPFRLQRPLQEHLGQLSLSQSSLLKPLLKLLERLPLPLMLQNSEGQVLMQNAVWQQQIGELLDPGWIQQEAAPWLESHPFESATSVAQSSPSPLIEHLSSPAAREPSRASFCQLGSSPNSCVCVCPLKTGQERLLQFVKVPLGALLLTDTSLDEAAGDLGYAGMMNAAAPFRLAALAKDAASSGPGNRAVGAIAAESTLQAAETLWLVLAQDVTEQQQLARELTAKNADLVQLNRLKDEFLACISHELKTPLTAVLGLSSLLKDQTLGALNQRQVHYAQLIYQSGRHLMAVVNDILDLTRIETGQLELVAEPVNIGTACRTAYDQACQLRLVEGKDQNASEAVAATPFSLELEAGLEYLVADELRLRQMLVHLLSNALKFTEPGNAIGLKVNRWGGWIAFTVWDTGLGIPADKQHLIFQKFQQLENPLTRRFEGTGLGLVLTQRLARLHGGDVTFISKERQGSQFTILLPPSPPDKAAIARGMDTAVNPEDTRALRKEHPLTQPGTSQALTAHAHPAKGVPVGRNHLVLLVEAAPQFIDTLSERLISLGYWVVIARSGTEALEKARSLQPCIIFLNPVLPLLSGWDVLTLLKSEETTRKIPVVITATKVDEERAQRNQADGCLSLPVHPQSLQHMLRQLVIEAKGPEVPARLPKQLTVLRLSHDLGDRGTDVIDLNELLHAQHCRVLEADDLEQADLLARVWKPNVILLDGTVPSPSLYFQTFCQHPSLASLPLITLDTEVTQAANQIPGLLVFPCLSPVRDTDAQQLGSSVLLRVIQIAAGYTWRPSVLAVDLSSMPMAGDVGPPLSRSESMLGSPPKEMEWLKALTQYLQTAGFRGLISHSWQEVLRQVQSQGVDLLLLCWTGDLHSSSVEEIVASLQQLQQLHPKPPILLLDHRQYRGSAQLVADVPEPFRPMVDAVIPPTMPMTQLLEQIHYAIQARRSGPN